MASTIRWPAGLSTLIPDASSRHPGGPDSGASGPKDPRCRQTTVCRHLAKANGAEGPELLNQRRGTSRHIFLTVSIFGRYYWDPNYVDQVVSRPGLGAIEVLRSFPTHTTALQDSFYSLSCSPPAATMWPSILEHAVRACQPPEASRSGLGGLRSRKPRLH